MELKSTEKRCSPLHDSFYAPIDKTFIMFIMFIFGIGDTVSPYLAK